MISIIKANKWLKGAVVALFWLCVWQLLSMLVHESLIFPSPIEVCGALVHLMAAPNFWFSSLASLIRIFIGFILGISIGFLAAYLSNRSKIINTFISPLLPILRSIPVASFIILALIWIKTNYLPAFISFMMVTPLTWTNMKAAFSKIDQNLLEMAKIYQFTAYKKLTAIEFPSVLPYFLATCTAGSGIAFKAGISAEIICRPLFSIGKQLQDAKTYLETPNLFAWTVFIILLSILTEKCFQFLFSNIAKKIKFL